MDFYQQMERILQTPLQQPTNIPQLQSQCQMQELNLIQKGLFDESKTPSSSLVQEGISFYENWYLFNVMVRNFLVLKDIFDKLTYLYTKDTSSNKTKQVLSLHLLFLFSTNQLEDYYSMIESLTKQDKEIKEIVSVQKFAELVSLGNYTQGIVHVHDQTQFHNIILENIQKSRRLDTCKLVDFVDSEIEQGDLLRMFHISSDKDLKDLEQYTQTLYDQQVINWKLVGGSILRRKKKQSVLEPNNVIKDMIGLVQQMENII